MRNVDVNDFSYYDVLAVIDFNVANVVCLSVNKAGEINRQLLLSNDSKTTNLSFNGYIDNLNKQAPIYNLKNENGTKEKFIRFNFSK